MKTPKLYFLVFICLALVTVESLTGCRKPRHCAYLVCQNGGYCDADTCVCKPGYYSALCQNNVRDQYLGVYNGTLTVTPPGTSANGTVTIKAGTEADAIIIASQVITLNAKISAGGYFVIPSQTGTLGTSSGSGSFAGNTLNFTVNQTVFTYKVTSNFTGTKQ